MISKAWRSVTGLLSSAIFATWLLVFIGAWSLIATFIPQTGESWGQDPAVWAAAHPTLERVAQTFGLHQAFVSPVFTASIILLGISTALCAWRRTKVANGKARTLHTAATTQAPVLAERHDFEIAVDGALGEPEALSRAEETFGHLGIKTKRGENLLSSVSPTWTVWGSPVFHWALLALIIALIIGNLLRADGQMGLAVGQTKPDVPESYGILTSGPMRNWGNVKRGFRLEGFEPDYTTGGINRGATPTVAVLDAAGKVVKVQRVYPNATLKSGSVTIYPKEYGLAVDVSVTDASGAPSGRSVQLVDFDPTMPEGTVSSGYLVISDAAGTAQLKMFITVPLDSKNGQFDEKVPASPSARVVLTTLEDEVVLDQVVGAGQTIGLPVGGGLQLNNVDYYARLSIVDDSSIPLLYAGLIIATIGLTIAVVARQQIVLATVVQGSEGPALAVKLRLWRNAPSNRREIEAELTKALSSAERGSDS